MDNTLYLIRHAQSHPKSSCHYSDWPLSSKGEKQAKALADLLAPLGIERIISSPFLRCMQTIGPFAKKQNIEINIEPDLRERLITLTIADDFQDIWRRSWEDFTFALPDCESSADAQRRFVAAVMRICDRYEDGTLAICSHGNVIGLFLNSFDPGVGIGVAEALKNPDVVKIKVHASACSWDRAFRLVGLEGIATRHDETPVQK
jgi:2,3-bisphosphoglycerate-dependent phosphoglycerate mutase